MAWCKAACRCRQPLSLPCPLSHRPVRFHRSGKCPSPFVTVHYGSRARPVTISSPASANAPPIAISSLPAFAWAQAVVSTVLGRCIRLHPGPNRDINCRLHSNASPRKGRVFEDTTGLSFSFMFPHATAFRALIFVDSRLTHLALQVSIKTITAMPMPCHAMPCLEKPPRRAHSSNHCTLTHCASFVCIFSSASYWWPG